jgi:hypothetical protein
MASRNAAIGTGVALAGLAGLAVAAVGVGAQNTATPLKPAADTVVTHTQTVRTVVHRTKHVKAHKRHDGRTVVRAADDSSGTGTTQNSLPVPATVPPATAVQSDDGPNHDATDDHGDREQELGDDRGGENEAGDDHGGDREDNSGPGGGGDDSGESQDD